MKPTSRIDFAQQALGVSDVRNSAPTASRAIASNQLDSEIDQSNRNGSRKDRIEVMIEKRYMR
jgi:hypothetical protein